MHVNIVIVFHGLAILTTLTTRIHFSVNIHKRLAHITLISIIITQLRAPQH